MPQAVEWRRALAAEAGRCRLLSLHGGPPPSAADGDIVGYSGLVGLGRGLATLRRETKRGGAEIVFAYYLTSYGVYAGLVCPGRYVAVAAGSDIYPSRRRGLREALARFALSRAAGAFAWTPEMADRLKALGARPDRIAVGPRGIDLSVFRPAPRAEVVAESPLRVVSTRRLRPLFRIDNLLRGVRAALDDGARLEVDIVGDGTEGPALRALTATLRLEAAVRFVGALPPEAVAEHVRRADVFVSLSRSDGLSTSLVEAMACGAYPIVSDIPANTGLVRDGDNGRVVDGDDPAAIAEALVRVWRDREATASARRSNVAQAAEHFDIRRNSARMLSTARAWVGVADPMRRSA
jgi:glycosyltransferase involved in cell wall biosynthesis